MIVEPAVDQPEQPSIRLRQVELLINGSIVSLLAGLTVLLGIQVWQSLQWRIVHDSAILHYIAYLLDQHGFVPYRDLFDTSLPASYLFHLAMGKTVGYGDLAFRITDVGVLLALLTLSWYLLRPLGKLAAWSAAVVFGLVYLGFGPSISLQRDYLGLLPISAALLLASRAQRGGWHGWALYFILGALFGLAVSLKPHLGLGLPIVLLLAILNRRADEQSSVIWVRVIAYAAIPATLGLLTVAAIPLVWVWQQGGLPAFLEIMTRYLPLYLHMTGEFKVLGRTDLVLYRFTSLQELGGFALLLVPAVLGGYHVLFESQTTAYNRRLALALLVLTAVYALYPVLAGQFWKYHWLPFIYFATLSASLLLVPLTNPSTLVGRRLFLYVVSIVSVILSLRPAPDFFRQIQGEPPQPVKAGRVDEIATFLRAELQPGDRVQPLDFVNGGVSHAMLLADAVIATPYQFDSQLYHDVSNPYTQARQRDFLSRLQAAPPRFMIEYLDRPRPTGPDTISSLPELERLIADDYSIVEAHSDYVIYERQK